MNILNLKKKCLGRVCRNVELPDLHDVDGVRADSVAADEALRRSDLVPQEAGQHRGMSRFLAELHHARRGGALRVLHPPAPVRGVLHVVLCHRLHVVHRRRGYRQPPHQTQCMYQLRKDIYNNRVYNFSRFAFSFIKYI